MYKGRGFIKFIKPALPFFSVIAATGFFLYFGQTFRYEFRKSRREIDKGNNFREELRRSGIQVREVTPEQIYQEVLEADDSSWQNIRGPRPYEDNREYEEANNSMGAASQRLFNSERMAGFKMVFVADYSLKMGQGKMAAQVAHAAVGLYQSAQTRTKWQQPLSSWLADGAIKVVLRGQDSLQLSELMVKANDEGLLTYMVQDAGRTQVAPGSRTVLGIFGGVETIDKVTGELKLL